MLLHTMTNIVDAAEKGYWQCDLLNTGPKIHRDGI